MPFSSHDKHTRFSFFIIFFSFGIHRRHSYCRAIIVCCCCCRGPGRGRRFGRSCVLFSCLASVTLLRLTQYESLVVSLSSYLYTHFCSTGFPIIIGRIAMISQSHRHKYCPLYPLERQTKELDDTMQLVEIPEKVTQRWKQRQQTSWNCFMHRWYPPIRIFCLPSLKRKCIFSRFFEQSERRRLMCSSPMHVKFTNENGNTEEINELNKFEMSISWRAQRVAYIL